MITIVKQEKIPKPRVSQWDLWTDGNKYICAKYQYGILTADIADNKEKWEDEDFITLTSCLIGEFYDHDMTLEELKEYTKDLFVWKC